MLTLIISGWWRIGGSILKISFSIFFFTKRSMTVITRKKHTIQRRKFLPNMILKVIENEIEPPRVMANSWP